jgi:hypothetical protein
MKILRTSNKDLTADKKNTFLTTDIASGGSTLTVQSIVGFTTNLPLCIGDIGEENSEIVQTHAATSPSGTTITLSANLTFSHNRGTKVYIVYWNQIEISWSETTTGSKAVLDTIAIQSDQNETIYTDTAKTSGYYFVRFKNSIDTTYSDYSDPISYSGYGANTVFSIKKRALDDLGEKIDGVIITDEWLNESLWEGRRELDNEESIGKWSFRIKRNYNAGSIIPGTFQLTLPTNLRKPTTAENILSIRIGEDGQELDYEDIVRFNRNYKGIKHTTLNGAVLAADTSIILTDSGDFDESGSIYVAGDSVDDTIDTIAYTANAETTNTISGVTGIQTGGHATGKDVWQNISFGLPTTFTIDGENKKAEFDIPFDDDYAGENIYMDYYSSLPVYDSDADELDEPQYDLFIDFLKWKIKYRKSNGKLEATKDSDFLLWEKKKKSFIAKEQLGQDIYLIPG